MLDPRLLRSDLDSVAKQLARRGMRVDTATINSLEENLKASKELKRDNRVVERKGRIDEGG